jgi:gliding-associated putative ABC transporter substrate-binding component GldG
MIKNLSKYKLFFISLAIIILINIIMSFVNWQIDLTSDKRFTLSKSTMSLVSNFEDIINAKVYLSGENPPGIENLESNVLDRLKQFKKINSKLVITYEDVNTGDNQQISKRYEELTKSGMRGTSLKVFDGKEYKQKVIFPYVTFQLGNRSAVVNLLESQSPGQDEQEVIQQSISLLEYKFANTIQKLQQDRKRNVVFTEGNGELSLQQTYMLEKDLRKWYNTGRIHLDSIVSLSPEIDVLVIAAPRIKLSDKAKFKIDQYLMNGGKIVWMIEKMSASLDSIAKYQFYIPQDIDAGVDDLLFKYGVKILPNLILDLESTSIPQIVGQSGDKPQTMMFKWPYHMLAASKSNHPIVKNIDRVNFYFPSQIDTVKTDGDVRKTVLMSSSEFSKVQFNPVRLNFEILKQNPSPDQFNQKDIPVAMLLEGKFVSAYRNRLTEDFKATLQSIKLPFKDLSNPAAQIVISDVDFAKSLLNPRSQEPEEIGFNKWEVRYFKGNKDFILNCIEYLMDPNGILESRSKEIKLRPLNKVKIDQERTFWQVINVVLPLILLVIAYFGISFWRKKRYI